MTVQSPGRWALLVPAALLGIVGVIDDRYNVGVSARLAAQLCAALIMMIGGDLYLRDIGGPFGTGRLGLGILAIPGSVLVTLTVINAFNFIDGVSPTLVPRCLRSASCRRLEVRMRNRLILWRISSAVLVHTKGLGLRLLASR